MSERAQHAPRVGLLIGSTSDRRVFDGALEVLGKLQVP